MPKIVDNHSGKEASLVHSVLNHRKSVRYSTSVHRLQLYYSSVRESIRIENPVNSGSCPDRGGVDIENDLKLSMSLKYYK